KGKRNCARDSRRTTTNVIVRYGNTIRLPTFKNNLYQSNEWFISHNICTPRFRLENLILGVFYNLKVVPVLYLSSYILLFFYMQLIPLRFPHFNISFNEEVIYIN